jgi:hypothetical protein
MRSAWPVLAKPRLIVGAASPTARPAANEGATWPLQRLRARLGSVRSGV